MAACTQTYVTVGDRAYPVFLPVVRAGRKEMEKRDEPYTFTEILKQLFGISIEETLARYVNARQREIRIQGYLTDCDRICLKPASTRVIWTESELGQELFHNEADLYVSAQLEGYSVADDRSITSGNKPVIFWMRYILDMWPCHRTCAGPLVTIVPKIPGPAERKKRWVYLNQYFLPVLYKNDYDLTTELIFKRYWPEVLEKAMPVDGYELARRMELPIRFVSFPPESTLMGQIFFDVTECTIMENGRRKKITVMPGTILINREMCKTDYDINTTIVHECCHMVLNTQFFFLQGMTGNCTSCGMAAGRNRKNGRKALMKRNLSPIEWMELQAEKLPAYLLLPEATVRRTVDEWIKHTFNGDRGPETMAQIVLGLVRDFRVSKAMAKYRLVELGYSEAEGVMNYIDGKYIKDHGCSGPWPAGAVFSVSFQDAVHMYGNDLGFTKAINSGRYIYVDGHFCLKDSKYVRRGYGNVYYLTEYARKHIDECCIAFHANGRAGRGNYEYGLAAREKTVPVTDRLNTRYSFTAEPGTEASRKEIGFFLQDAELWGALERGFPDDFAGSLLSIMKAKGITQSELSLRFNVDRKIIYKLLNAPQPSVAHIVAACVALDVPYQISEVLLRKAGHVLRSIPLHNVYRMILNNTATLTIEMCDEILRSKRLPTLFQGAA